MFLADYHLHTNQSSDSDATPQSMIERAIDLGLAEIALTDHVDFDPRYTFTDYNKYIPVFNSLKEGYADKIHLTFGVEIGLENKQADKVNTFARSFPFDFIIGSSHSVERYDLYFDREKYFERFSGKQAAYENYFKELIKNIQACPVFNVYGHIDFVNRYGTYEDNSLKYADFSDYADTALKLLAENGKGIEINTSGFRYGVGSAHPSLDFVKRYRELGGEIITVGSDAHRPEDIAENFEQAYEMLKTAGFRYIAFFRYQKPVFKKLP